LHTLLMLLMVKGYFVRACFNRVLDEVFYSIYIPIRETVPWLCVLSLHKKNIPAAAAQRPKQDLAF